jgi:hypothetical protein
VEVHVRGIRQVKDYLLVELSNGLSMLEFLSQLVVNHFLTFRLLLNPLKDSHHGVLLDSISN